MRGWIPPVPLACGILSFGGSWIVLFAIARSGSFDASLLSLGWVHLVALGWITTIALAILLHAVPAFLDVDWEGGGAATARACTPVFAIASLALSIGFLTSSIVTLQIAGTIALVTLLVYVVAIATPLIAAMRGEALQRAVARAFCITFVLLLVTATLGVTFAYALGGRIGASLLATLPPAHAMLGIGGWLTLLVVGVSARTMGPIAGARSRFRVLHIGGSSAVLFGTVIVACGAWLQSSATLIVGAALLLLGTCAYATDIGDIIKRATVTHRPPQAFMLGGALWAVVASVFIIGAASGHPCAEAAIYAALIGWIGSAVLAHLHHIGVRVLLTTLRGEDDETRPGEVLRAPLSWATFALYECAAIVGTFALSAHDTLALEGAAVAGFAAFAVTLANLTRAAAFVGASKGA